MLDQLLNRIESPKHQLLNHSIYQKLNSLASLKTFMSIHIFAVWDFMNMVTALQSKLTCTSLPWQPPQSPTLARFINEIKLEEESDIIDQNSTSHFQYYLKSMASLQIDTQAIETFQSEIKTHSYESLLNHSSIPNEIRPFLKNTHQCINQGLIATAASFTFGRETIIPEMFVNILNQSTDQNPDIEPFNQYLKRHIELDGDSHSQIALDLVSELCQNDPKNWEQASESAVLAIQSRIDLYTQIESLL